MCVNATVRERDRAGAIMVLPTNRHQPTTSNAAPKTVAFLSDRCSLLLYYLHGLTPAVIEVLYITSDDTSAENGFQMFTHFGEHVLG